MKKLLLLSLSCCVLFLYACAQGSTRVYKVYAFVKITIPGMPMADKDGNRVNPEPVKEHFLYVETRGQQPPDFDMVYYNAAAFACTPVKVTDKKIGIQKDNGEPVVLKTAKGNTLWQLELQPVNGAKVSNSDQVLQIKLKKGKRVNVYPRKEIELVAPEMY